MCEGRADSVTKCMAWRANGRDGEARRDPSTNRGSRQYKVMPHVNRHESITLGPSSVILGLGFQVIQVACKERVVHAADGRLPVDRSHVESVTAALMGLDPVAMPFR